MGIFHFMKARTAGGGHPCPDRRQQVPADAGGHQRRAAADAGLGGRQRPRRRPHALDFGKTRLIHVVKQDQETLDGAGTPQCIRKYSHQAITNSISTSLQNSACVAEQATTSWTTPRVLMQTVVHGCRRC